MGADGKYIYFRIQDNILMKKEAIFLLMLALMCSPVYAATLHVGSGQAYATIQAAVNAASPGDTIKIHPGTYHETVTVSKNGLTIEAYDPNNPPELDGADLDFANSAHTWTHVQGNIYRTTYDLPFSMVTPTTFTNAAYSGGGTGHNGDPVMTVYEDDIWLRGYEGMNYNELSYPYSTLDDLDPSLDEKSDSNREIRIPGRFMYDDANNLLYVWTAEEHGEDSPSNHKYYIPVLKNLIVINAPDVTLRNLVMKHTYFFAVDIKSSGDGTAVENCYIINTGPWAITGHNAADVSILNNFIQLKGFYDRQDYISTRFNILKNDMIDIQGYASAKNCELAGNVVTGAYGIMARGQDCRIHDNIISKSQSILIIPNVESSVPQSGYLQNVRIYHNILHHADFSAFTNYNTLSADKNNYYGPIWFYRNVIYAVPQINKDGCQDSPCDPTPDTYIYQNTFVLGKSVVHHPYDYPVRKSTVYRNNIVYLRHNKGMEMYWIYSSKEKSKGWSYFPFTVGPDSDYNIYWREPIYDWTQIARFRYKADVDAGIYTSYKEGEFSKMRQETGIDPHSIEADPELVHRDEFATASAFDVAYDRISGMDYKEVISQGFESLFSQEFDRLYHYFDVQPGSPAIDKGEALPSSWPDTLTVTDGKPDIGAVEYGGVSSCTPHWTCTDWSDWSACDGGKQTRTRTCTDDNACGTISGKPATTDTQSCSTTPALVSRWDFNKGSGTTAEDSAGNNDGTISGASWTTDSRTGGHALEFDGADDYVMVGDGASLDPAYVTVSLWFKPESLEDNTGLIAKGDNENRQYWIWIYDSSISLELDEGGHYNNIYSLQRGLWYHLAVTYDGANIITYIDGTEVSRIPQSTGSIFTGSEPLYIGKLPGYVSFHGIIDDVRVYNYALSQAEVQEIYDSEKSSCGKADLDGDGSVSISELISFISGWKSGDRTIGELIDAIGKWKGGC